MDNQRSPLLNWTYFHQEKSMDHEVRQSLALSMELQDTIRLKAQEDLKMRDEQISQLKHLLNLAIQDRNEAQQKCQQVLFEKRLLQQQLQQQQNSTPHSGVSNSSIEDCDESIVSSPHQELPVAINKPLPEKGKLLEAVMKAGPLLQTLLLAGPLPQWRHPPPPMEACQIPAPPVVMPSPAAASNLIDHDPFENVMNNVNKCGSRVNRKRGVCEGSDSSSIVNELKYQRVVLH